jgi:hypothetical protein
MNKTLKWFNNEYEKILYCGLSDEQKDREFSGIMSEMEHEFKIPMIRDEAWERENRAVIALYRKISMSRKL